MNSITDILKKPIVKISSLNGVSVLVRILGGLVTSKVIAEFVGAGGMAVMGNLRNFLTSLDAYATLGMQNGIIKYTAENNAAEEKLYRILGTVFLSILCVIIILSIGLFFLSEYFSFWVFKDYDEYSWLFKLLALLLPWYAGSLLLMYILNGLGNYKQVIWLNIIGNITGVVISAFLMWKFQTNGGLLGLIIFQAVSFIFAFYCVWRRFPGLPFLRINFFDISIFKGLLSYSLMTLLTALIAPIVYLAIRNNLIVNFSPDTAGHWEAINRLSSFYMMFATTMLTVYFLPKLSIAQTRQDTKAVVLSYYKSILPLFLVGLLAIYFLKEVIILIIFKRDFMPMTELFFWQLLGDFFKVGSLILGYLFFAKKLTRAFIITEVISFSIMYLSSFYFIDTYGVKGAVIAHALTYAIYWAMLVIYFRKMLIKLEK